MVLQSRDINVLQYIVEDYILNGLPVPSKKIAEFPEMQVSSATIRNVVSELEMNGYVTRPHSSAGSIPARKAYRLYVEALGSVNEMMLSSKLRKKVRHQLIQSVSDDINTWGSTAVNLLSNLVGSLAIVTAPQSFQLYVNQIHVIKIQNNTLLLIVVFPGAVIKQKILSFPNHIDQSLIDESITYLNHIFVNKSYHQIKDVDLPLGIVKKKLFKSVLFVLEEQQQKIQFDYRLDGLRNLLIQPEFVNRNGLLHSLVHDIEQGELLQLIMSLMPQVGTVRVVIGDEHSNNKMRPFSLIIGCYGISNNMIGSIAVVDSVRMQYLKGIASVKLMVNIMTDITRMVA